jgi:hypothetical protein
VAEERPVYETLLDYFFYAPLGAATVFVEQAPRFAEVGRERVEKRIAVAALIGKFAVAEARRRLEAAPSGQPREQARPSEPQARPPLVTPRGATPATPAPTAVPVPVTRGHERAPRPKPASRRVPSGPADSAGNVPGRELPIPAYDTLAASQVVERLASLTPSELETVRKHESATRRRRTVLHRIAQLSSGRDSATA